jgi:hypothetical protein
LCRKREALTLLSPKKRLAELEDALARRFARFEVEGPWTAAP